MQHHILSAELPAPSKTVGARTAQLTTTLYERGQTTFTLAADIVPSVKQTRPLVVRGTSNAMSVELLRRL